SAPLADQSANSGHWCGPPLLPHWNGWCDSYRCAHATASPAALTLLLLDPKHLNPATLQKPEVAARCPWCNPNGPHLKTPWKVSPYCDASARAHHGIHGGYLQLKSQRSRPCRGGQEIRQRLKNDHSARQSGFQLCSLQSRRSIPCRSRGTIQQSCARWIPDESR